MFSRLYDSARSFISYPTRPEEVTAPNKIIIDETMVATQKQQLEDEVEKHGDEDDEEGLNDDNTIHVYVPSSSAKKRPASEDESNGSDEAITPTSKKRKILPVRAKDTEEVPVRKSRLVVEIPAMRITPLPASQTRTESIKDSEDEESEDQDSDEEPEQQSQDTGSGAAEGEEEEIGATFTEDSEVVKSKHRKFGSEEPEEFFSTARELVVDAQSEEEVENEDSDDDAPEAVGKDDAVEIVKSRARDAANAIKEQLLASRKKRKEKEDARKQVLERNKIKEQRRAKKAAAKLSKLASRSERDDDLQTTENGPEQRTTQILDPRKTLPGLLPLEYLEDDDTSMEAMPVKVEASRERSKKIKFQDLIDKQPKDRRKGTTTYRVTKVSSKELAPKAVFHARRNKEAWLQGRAGKAMGERKVMSTGFLKR